MELCDAINKAIEDFGKEVLLDGKRLYNILNDWNAYETKALRRVTETILNMGYGRQLHRLFGISESERQLKIKSFITDIVSEGLQREIVCEVFNNFALAMYWEPVYSDSPKDEPSKVKHIKKTPSNQPKEEQIIVTPRMIAKLSETLRTTYKLVSEGKSVVAIARLRNLKEQTIASHISDLIENGFLSVHRYVDNSTYQIVASAYKQLGQPTLSELHEFLQGAYEYRDIKYVVSDIMRQQKAVVSKKITNSTGALKPKTIRNLQVLKSSKELFDMDCTVDITMSGYYLSVDGKHIKLADLCCPISKTNPGHIWRMSPTIRGYEYRLVHKFDGEKYPFGEIKKTNDEIKFKPESGKVITISL